MLSGCPESGFAAVGGDHFCLSHATSGQHVGHHPWQRGQAGLTCRVNARLGDDNVGKLTPQCGFGNLLFIQKGLLEFLFLPLPSS